MRLVTAVLLLITIYSCQPKDGEVVSSSGPLFEKIDSSYTLVNFRNDLRFDKEFNIFTYRNFYNGGGVAIGDINNDGLVDIYFTANQLSNKLYLNKGDFQFEDITEKAGVGGQRAWSTGVSMADVNGDGWLDIYVCNSGDIEGDNKQNELFINNGDMTFTESGEQYGLNDKGYSTHAAFFDYDRDGDLDVYLLNNSYQAIGSFNLMQNVRPKRDSIGGDKLYRNDNNNFIDIPYRNSQAKPNHTAIYSGLFADINKIVIVISV
ncbi:MAG: VCBS repeat-containing protein, partial [Bacteroidota bacterium]